jgi:hypothetical protein
MAVLLTPLQSHGCSDALRVMLHLLKAYLDREVSSANSYS